MKKQASPGVSLAIPVFYYKLCHLMWERQRILLIKPILLAHNFLRPNLLQQADKPREKGDSADTFDGNGISHAAKAEEQQPENEQQDNPFSLHIISFLKVIQADNRRLKPPTFSTNPAKSGHQQVNIINPDDKHKSHPVLLLPERGL